ncbi:MAG: ABC transporter ATP-binding protein [Desulfobacteraceae bacterium]|nr:ABC transporter ATP-binding protein [Desulfobacteraceae bacterium]MBC2751739.1 ABC transporter ATP-binding protein [Desulfobacteraceae bacterium]
MIGEHLTKHYGRGEAVVSAIEDMNFVIESGEFVAVMGESGAGKSTLLSIMGAMNAPSAGTLTVEGIDVYSLGQEQRADFRREFLGFVFQSFHLIAYLTLEENVMLPLATIRMPRRRKLAMAREALASVGLDGKGKRLPHQISGGESERTAIARAIVNQPPIILADEPTGNLDSRTSREVMLLLQRLKNDGTTVVMVTHSLACAGYADRVMQMADGRLAAPPKAATVPAQAA